jgi:hypothetical protein
LWLGSPHKFHAALSPHFFPPHFRSFGVFLSPFRNSSSKEVEVRVEQPQDPPSTTTNNSLDHHVEAVFKEYFTTPPKKDTLYPQAPIVLV